MTFHKGQRNLTMDDVVKTRDGRSARIVSVDHVQIRNVVAFVDTNNDGQEYVISYYSNGDFSRKHLRDPSHMLDLVLQ